MRRLFFDSSVLFSAIYSTRGHARDLLNMAIRGQVTLVVSQLVLDETRRNLAEEETSLASLFDFFITRVAFDRVEPTRREVNAAAKHVAEKDRAIVAAARKAKPDLFVTVDKKHLLGRPALAKYVRAPIVTPIGAVAYLSRKN
jgi:predicted nucleic acid-binding protein